MRIVPKPHRMSNGQHVTHCYLGGDGERSELDAWAEMRPDGWAIHWTGEGIPKGKRATAMGRWATYAEACAAWNRASRSHCEKLEIEGLA